MLFFRGLSLLFVVIVASSCSSAATREPAKERSAYDRSHILPDNVFRNVFDIAVKSNSSPSNKLKAIRGQICDGKKPRFEIRFTTSAESMAKTKGLPIDQAARKTVEDRQKTREWLKNNFFMAVAEDGEQIRLDGDKDFDFVDDMALLTQNFVIIVPKKVAEKIPNIPGYGGVGGDNNDYMLQYWGYKYEDGEFSPTLAVEHRDFVWRHVLAASTTLKQSPNIYEVSLNWDMFCQYSVPITDLISN